MDIKLKNKYVYIATYVLCIYSLSLSILIGCDIIKYRYCFKDKPYFYSPEFKYEFNVFILDVSNVYDYVNKSQDMDKTEASKYEELKHSIDNNENIKYYILDKKSNQIYTSIKNLSNINDYMKNHSLFYKKFPTDNINDGLQWQVSNFFKDSGFEAYIIVPNDTGPYRSLSQKIKHYNLIKTRIYKEIPIFVSSLIISLILFWFIRNKKAHSFEFSFFKKIKSLYKRIPFDLRILFFISYSIMMEMFFEGTPIAAEPFFINKFIILSVASVYFLYAVPVINEAIKLMKSKDAIKHEWNGSLFHKSVLSFKDLFINKKIALITIGAIVLGITFILVTADDLMFFELIYIILVPIYMIKTVGYLNKILKGTEEIVSGNLNYNIEECGKGQIPQLARNINKMRGSFKASLDSEMKSERFKSELITNVSHDLRTPLTSIINYVNILKQEGLSKEDMDKYINILDRKTQRLKVLIDDLFEASKMTSGAIELSINQVDIVSLLNQTIGELNEKIRNSSLTFRINAPNHHIYLNLDGKKTWRVLENLIGNALKYSQPNTRVYIDLLEEKSSVKLIIKNISSYELNFDTEEIFQRFKRGDKSRTTEGSGLGLAIAKSIVELHGGNLSIEIDGDLFKAIVEWHK